MAAAEIESRKEIESSREHHRTSAHSPPARANSPYFRFSLL